MHWNPEGSPARSDEHGKVCRRFPISVRTGVRQCQFSSKFLMMVFSEVRVNYWRSLICILLLAGNCFALPSAPDTSDRAAIDEAVRWIQAMPSIRAEYQYILTCRLRLLIFWVARDDLGGGYIKTGQAADDPSFRMIQLLFGSDPAKTPRAINRWGAGTEVDKIDSGKTTASSAFVGFMKSSQGQSVSAMQQELSHERTAGKHRFEAIISRVDGARAISTTVPFYSDKDYDMSQLSDVQGMALNQLGDNQARKFRRLNRPERGGCDRPGGFLSTTEELLERSLTEEKTPVSLCYVYNARPYTLTLQRVIPVPIEEVQVTLKDRAQKIHESYRDLKESQFQIRNGESGAKTNFSVLLGTTGDLRGVPVQINYQPNWWFQIVLNLKTRSGGEGGKLRPESF
jgi:hypothetical protein